MSTKDRDNESAAANDGGSRHGGIRRSGVVEFPRDPRALVIIGSPDLEVGVVHKEMYTVIKIYVPSASGEEKRR